MTVNKSNEEFYLSDGRKLGYAIYGDPDGVPVLFFHGIPGSLLQLAPDIEFLKKSSVCLYSLDRPGIGLSTAKPERSVLDWSDDVKIFCHGLNIQRFSIIGVSGGAPYALACALRLHQYIQHVYLISGLAPINYGSNLRQLDPRLQFIFKIAPRHPRLLDGYLAIVYKFFKKTPVDAFNYFMSHLPDYDKHVLTSPDSVSLFRSDLSEAFRQGSEGIVSEILTLLKPWGFDLTEIDLPIHVWHGTADSIVPFNLFNYTVSKLPNAIPHIVDNGGHFIALEYASQILGALTSESADSPQR